MNTRPPLMTLLKQAGHSEHIAIQGEPEDIVGSVKQPYRKPLLSYRSGGRLRGYRTEVSILDEHYLGVCQVQSKRAQLKYQVDLRFLNSRPVRIRRVSWLWFGAWIVLLAAGAGLFAGISSGVMQYGVEVFGGAAAMVCASFGAVLMCLRYSTESLEFRSVHGDAALLSVTGGFGSARRGKSFFVELIKHIYAANRARPRTKEQLLRDEMREHYRLRQAGVLTEQQYEQSKSRILAAH